MKTALNLGSLVAAVGDAVVACDAWGAIVLWNPAAERLFGYQESEALGQSLDIIIPQPLQQRHWDGYQKTMETGHTKYGHDVLRVPAVDKSGREMSIAFTVAMLFSSDGKPEVVVSVIRDETARFKKDREMRKRLAELEAKSGEH